MGRCRPLARAAWRWPGPPPGDLVRHLGRDVQSAAGASAQRRDHRRGGSPPPRTNGTRSKSRCRGSNGVDFRAGKPKLKPGLKPLGWIGGRSRNCELHGESAPNVAPGSRHPAHGRIVGQRSPVATRLGRFGGRAQRRDWLTGVIMVAPVLLLIAVFFIYLAVSRGLPEHAHRIAHLPVPLCWVAELPRHSRRASSSGRRQKTRSSSCSGGAGVAGAGECLSRCC